MTFATETYPVTITVAVCWPEGDQHIDAIKGESAEHAMARATDNWPGAEIILLAEGDQTEAWL